MNEQRHTSRSLRSFPKKTVTALAAGAIALTALVQIPAFADDRGPGARAEQGEQRCEPGRWSGKHGRGERGEHAGKGMRMFQGLNLTDEQKAKLTELRESQKSAMQGQHEAMRAAREGMRDLMRSGEFDQAKAQALADQIGATASAMAMQRASMGHQMMAILTDEQKAELIKRRAERGERGRGHDGEGHHRHGEGGSRSGRG